MYHWPIAALIYTVGVANGNKYDLSSQPWIEFLDSKRLHRLRSITAASLRPPSSLYYILMRHNLSIYRCQERGGSYHGAPGMLQTLDTNLNPCDRGNERSSCDHMYIHFAVVHICECLHGRRNSSVTTPVH